MKSDQHLEMLFPLLHLSLETDRCIWKYRSIQNFSDVINSAKGALTTFAGFLEEHSDIIAKLITQLPKLLVAYKGFKIVKSVTPGIIGFGSAIGKLAKSGLEKLSPNLKNVSKGQDAVGNQVPQVLKRYFHPQRRL